MGFALNDTEYDESYPETLEILVKRGYIRQSVLQCPAAAPDSEPDYFYVPPDGKTVARGSIIACDHRDNHGGAFRNVLMHPSTVKGMTEQEFQDLLAQPQNEAFAEKLREFEGR